MTQSLVGARERAREVALRDLADAEVLALVLGTGVAGEPVAVLAASLLEAFDGVEPMARAGFGEIAGRRGLGVARALRLAAAFELGRRARAAREDLPWAPDSRGVAAWARAKIADLEHEELWVLALDGQHRVRAARRVASGGLHGLAVSVRDPLRFALREGASAMVVVHNHPSGDPTPSIEDLAFTERLVAAGDAAGTPLLDHVVVAGERHRSMLDDGLLPERGTSSRASLSERARAAASPSRGGRG